MDRERSCRSGPERRPMDGFPDGDRFGAHNALQAGSWAQMRVRLATVAVSRRWALVLARPR